VADAQREALPVGRVDAEQSVEVVRYQSDPADGEIVALQRGQRQVAQAPRLPERGQLLERYQRRAPYLARPTRLALLYCD
jgi:hypothetical protein